MKTILTACIFAAASACVTAQTTAHQATPVDLFATPENCRTFLGQDSNTRDGVTPQYAIALSKALEHIAGKGPIKQASLQTIRVYCSKVLSVPAASADQAKK